MKLFTDNLCFAVTMFATLNIIFYVNCEISCKNHKNESVDWFILYKLPKIKNSNTVKWLNKGLSYVYITSESLKSNTQKWILSDFGINDPKSLLVYRTTIQVTTKETFYTIKGSTLYHILYNDQPPERATSETKGHAKGILFGNKESSIWIVHSIPHFVSIENKTYVYPATAQIYGQTALCITYKTKHINEIINQLFYYDPFIYSSNYSDKIYLAEVLPNFLKLISNKTPFINEPPWNRSYSSTSYAGKEFLSLAKYRKFDKDLYNDWISDYVKSDLYVETWLNSPGPLPSNCTKTFHVYNINTISFNSLKITFKSSKDHSKWAIDVKHWICIGGINREKQQLHRSGGTVCIKDYNIWRAFKNLVLEVDPCNLTRFHH